MKYIENASPEELKSIDFLRKMSESISTEPNNRNSGCVGVHVIYRHLTDTLELVWIGDTEWHIFDTNANYIDGNQNLLFDYDHYKRLEGDSAVWPQSARNTMHVDNNNVFGLRPAGKGKIGQVPSAYFRPSSKLDDSSTSAVWSRLTLDVRDNTSKWFATKTIPNFRQRGLVLVAYSDGIGDIFDASHPSEKATRKWMIDQMTSAESGVAQKIAMALECRWYQPHHCITGPNEGVNFPDLVGEDVGDDISFAFLCFITKDVTTHGEKDTTSITAVSTSPVEFLSFAKGHIAPGSDARLALEKLLVDYAYCSPELEDDMWMKVYHDFILSHVAPHDKEAWTMPIYERWGVVMLLRKSEKTKEACVLE